MTEYNRTQTDYRERCKSRIQRQLEISKYSFIYKQATVHLASWSYKINNEGGKKYPTFLVRLQLKKIA